MHISTHLAYIPRSYVHTGIFLIVDVDASEDMSDVSAMPTFKVFEWEKSKPLDNSKKYLGMTFLQEVCIHLWMHHACKRV